MSIVHNFDHGLYCAKCNTNLALVDKYLRAGVTGTKCFTLSCPKCQVIINLEVNKAFLQLMMSFGIEVN
jgi:hypothetical protein